MRFTQRLFRTGFMLGIRWAKSILCRQSTTGTCPHSPDVCDRRKEVDRVEGELDQSLEKKWWKRK